MEVIFSKDSLQKRTYAAGEPIINNESTRMLFFVISGKVDAYNQQAFLIASYGPGRYFNARHFFFKDDAITFIADENTQLYAVNKDALLQLLAANNQNGYMLLQEAFATPGEHIRIKEEQEAGLSIIAQIQEAFVNVEEADDKLVKESVPEATAAGTNEDVKQQAAGAVKGAFPSFFLPEHKGYLGITHPEYRQLVFEKEYTCPCCDKKFHSYRVFNSKLVNEKPPRYDLRQYYKNFEVEWYDIITCKYCYFSTFSSLFLEPKGFSGSAIVNKLKDARNELTLNFEQERDIEYVIATHYLALLTANAFSSYRQLKARIWGNLSWLYEDTGDEEIAKTAALNAAEAYKTLYLESKLNALQEQHTSLTIAGMLYRVGELKDIKRWLLQAKRINNGKKQYVDLADDLIDMLRKDVPTTLES